jgi:hypothetical protein
VDLTNLYAFPKPGDAGKSILIMNVHPSVYDYTDRENPLGATIAESFAPEALYEVKADTDGDAVADIACRVRFSSSKVGGRPRRYATLRARRAAGTGDGGQALVDGAPVSTGRAARVREAGDYRFFSGRRSDPFLHRQAGRPQQPGFHRRRFLRRQRRAQHRAGSAQLCPGAQSGWPVPPLAEELRSPLKHASFLLLPAGHWLQINVPEQVAKEVLL